MTGFMFSYLKKSPSTATAARLQHRLRKVFVPKYVPR